MGDVTGWKDWDIDWESINLIMAGSPCQGFSKSGKGLNFEDPRSQLLFVFLEILNFVKEKNPNVKFLLENVEMKKEWENTITELMEVEPIKINSKLVSAQKRPRVYWTNIEGVTQPEDKNIKLSDVLEESADLSFYLLRSNEAELCEFVENELRIRQATKKGYAIAEIGDSINLSNPNSKTRRGRVGKEKCNTLDTQCNYAVYIKNGYINKPNDLNQIGFINKNSQASRFYDINGKSACLKAKGGGWGAKMGLYLVEEGIRKVTPTECERLQTLPDGYTEGISNSKRYFHLGNGWTKDVITHILSFMEV